MDYPHEWLIGKYNPHSQQKNITKNINVKKSSCSLSKDISNKTNLIWSTTIDNDINLYTALQSTEEQQSEYGIDSCRIAELTHNFCAPPAVLLESSLKWLNNFYAAFISNNTLHFSSKEWLQTAFEIRDHILKRNSIPFAFSLIKKLFKTNKPSINISTQDKRLVLSSIYPFTPVLSLYLAFNMNLFPLQSISSLLQGYPQYIVSKYRVNSGGWYQIVFEKHSFLHAAEQTLLNNKKLKKICTEKNCVISRTDEGFEICLS